MKKLIILTIILLVNCTERDDFDDVRVSTQDDFDDVRASTQTGDLNSVFKNALISDLRNNITRTQNITITAVDSKNHRIKTNYNNLSNLTEFGTSGESWFICQGNQASTLVEITVVDTRSGWIYYGEVHSGSFNSSVGSKVEFFNPFINYKFIPANRPLFAPYPTSVIEGIFNYIQSGGVIEKTDGTYVLLCPVVFGRHASRSIYYATSDNLEHWTFVNTKLLSTDQISFARTTGNVFSLGNPMKLNNGNYLVLLGVQQTNRNYTSAYMIMNENLSIVQQPQEIMINGWNGTGQNGFPLSIIKYDGKYRLLLHRRHSANINREIHEIIINGGNETTLFNALNNGVIESSTMIHKGTTSSGYLAGKADDAVYIEYNNKLYMFIGGESETRGWVTHQNREYGLAKLIGNTWEHDVRSPLIINPVQLFKAYPEYNFAWDHAGGFISPIIKNGYLYVFLAMGTDYPDYFLSGIKIGSADFLKNL